MEFESSKVLKVKKLVLIKGYRFGIQYGYIKKQTN